MPTYSYQCTKCQAVQEVYHSIGAEPEIRCGDCGAGTRRLMGSGAGILFRGTGFYETDYKRGNGHGKSSDTKSSETKSESNSSASKGEGASSDGASSSKPASGGSDSTQAA